VGLGRSAGVPVVPVGLSAPSGRTEVRPTQPSRPLPRTGAPGARQGVAAVLAFVLAVLGVTAASLGGAPAASAASSCSSPVPAGQIRVVMVVDPGETGPRGPTATCLVVAAGTSGAKILAQRASQLGLPAPRYAESGLLCGLDGFPSTGCPVNSGGGYDYWAYFNGVGGSWSFGHDNPFVRRMVDGEIMGWRYAVGAADGQAPRPRIAPSSSLFPSLAPAPTAPPATAPPTGGGGGAPSGGGGAAPGSTGGAPAIPDLSGLTVPDGSTPPTLADGTPSTLADGTPATTVDGATTDEDAAAGSDEGSTEVVEGDIEELAAQPSSSTGSDAGRWVGAAVVAVVFLALVIGAIVVNRGRARARTG
jgi:hypothetical protein